MERCEISMALKNHGITADTLGNIMLGAGTIYKNLKYTAGKGVGAGDWNGTQLGATSGGITFSYEPEYLDVEVDGATVAVKGLTKQKVAETASIKGNMTEVTEGVVVDALHLTEDASKSVEGVHKCYTTKANISESDYLENIAYVGFTSSGKKIIIILENAICISAFELAGENKNQTTFEVEFTCTGSLESGDLSKLPIYIYYPQEAQV